MRKISIYFFWLFGLVACVTTPVSERKAFNIIPDSKMAELGNQAYQEILHKEKISSNKAATEQMVKVAERIAKASAVDFEWRFVLLDEAKTINAFCLPGGKVAVYTGILPVAENEAGLAAVLGHEVAHAVAKHGAERMSQALAVKTGLEVGGLALGDNKYRGLILGALGLGAEIGVMLPYSRMHELEADRIGLLYMARAGYDPAEAVALWRRMAQAGGKGPPQILSTHPDSEARARALEKALAEVADAYQKSDKQPTQKLVY